MARKKKATTPEELKRCIEIKLRRTISEGAWDHAIQHPDFIDIFKYYKRGEEEFDSLVEWMDDRLSFADAAGPISEPPPRVKPESPREYQRIMAFAHMVEAYINNHPDVLEFRKKHLKEGLLKTEGKIFASSQVTWLKEQSNEFKKALNELAERFTWLTLGGWIEREHIMCIVLTGKNEFNSLVKVKTSRDPFWGYKYVIEIAPTVNPSELLSIIKRRVINEYPHKKKLRALSVKSIRLAEFVLTHNESWEERKEKWNGEYPKWKYSDRRRFARDAKSAVEQAGLGIFTV